MMEEDFEQIGNELRKKMIDIVNKLRREKGMKVMMVKKKKEEEMNIEEMIILIEKGKIEEKGKEKEMMQRDGKEEIRKYIGEMRRFQERE